MSMIYWFIGQPGCGKSTLAKALKKRFDDMRLSSVHLDGDDLRVIFGNQYQPEHFTEEYRVNSTRQLQRFAEHVAKQGVAVILSTVNAKREVREELKARNKRVREIYVVNSGSHVREDRKYNDFEEPLMNFIMIDTKGRRTMESLNIVFDEIVRRHPDPDEC